MNALAGVLALLAALPGGSPAAPPPAARAQGGAGIHLLVVSGLAGEPRFAAAFHEAAVRVLDVARTRWRVADSSALYLAEDPARDPARITGRATREAVQAALVRLAGRAAAGDLVLVFLLGHGSGQGSASRLGLPGPDLTAGDVATWLAPFARQRVVVINAASASGDWLPVLAAPDRVVITATRSALEANETTFGGHFARALAGEGADADKDGAVTLLEAFTAARRETLKGYEDRNRLPTEHAILDDNGDGKGSDSFGTERGDGLVARGIAFGLAPASTDPRVAALAAERRRLEGEVGALRRRKDAMEASAYERELEALLLRIAEATRAIRALEGGRKP